MHTHQNLVLVERRKVFRIPIASDCDYDDDAGVIPRKNKKRPRTYIYIFLDILFLLQFGRRPSKSEENEIYYNLILLFALYRPSFSVVWQWSTNSVFFRTQAERKCYLILNFHFQLSGRVSKRVKTYSRVLLHVSAGIHWMPNYRFRLLVNIFANKWVVPIPSHVASKIQEALLAVAANGHHHHHLSGFLFLLREETNITGKVVVWKDKVCQISQSAVCPKIRKCCFCSPSRWPTCFVSASIAFGRIVMTT